MVLTVLFVLALAGTLASSVYTVLALCAGSYYRRQSARWLPSHDNPEVALSVLKPVHGETSDLRENLLSFYQQDHSNFELLFSARTLSDLALSIVRDFMSRFPSIPTQIIASGEPEWPNARAFSVNALVAVASRDILVITDSDVRVPPDFLRTAVVPLIEPGVGLVTCPYRGVSSGGLWTDLEALGMSVELMCNVLTANMLNGMDFALGPATAARRDTLDAIGGLAATGDYYADDFALGNLISRKGLQVVLSPVVVEHVIPRSSFASSFQHQVLWLKNNRFLRMREHFGVVLTFAMPYALLGSVIELARQHAGLAFCWLACGIANCIIRSVAIGWRIVADRHSLTKCWLYPLRDLIGFATWIATWFGDKVTFRGEPYQLLNGGKVRRLPSQ